MQLIITVLSISIFKMGFKHITEYISTEDGTEGTILIPKLIFSTLIPAVNKALLPRELASMVLGPSQIQGSSMTINLESPNTLDIRQVSEGAEIPLDNIDIDTVTVRPVKYGVAVRITREMIEDSQFAMFEKNLVVVGKRFAEKETELIISALVAGTGATTAGGAAITIANITESMQDLEDNDYNPTDILIGTEVLNDLRNIDTFVEAQRAGDTEMLTTGWKGNIYGLKVTLFSSNATSDPSTYKKYAFVIDRTEAYLIAIKRDITVENYNVPTYDMQGAAITMRISVHVLRSNAISKITTS